MSIPVETTSATQSVLLIGASGMLGHRIGIHLAARADVRVRLMVGASADRVELESIQPLLERCAQLVEGDFRDPASLDRATRGIDVVVSAVQGGAHIMEGGPLALAEAGRRNGVRRIVLAGLGLDVVDDTSTEPAGPDARARSARAIAALGLEHIHIVHGGFMELLGPGSPWLDYHRAVANYWGDATLPFDVTSLDDTARMTARAALDRDLANGIFAFAGDRVSFAQAAALAEAHTGGHFDLHCLGSAFDLRRAVSQAAERDPQQAAVLASMLHTMTRPTARGDLQNHRYPDIRLETLADFLVHEVPRSAATARPVAAIDDATSPHRPEGFTASTGPR